MKAFINGTGIISPQGFFSGTALPAIPVASINNRFKCIEPPYQEILNPVSARRMGRLIKMGIAAASLCMKDAELTSPDAIITGTALGIMGETEKFLKAMIADNEQFLTPTSFIQSLQNSVAAQVALHLSCTGHNFTFSHRGFSFENALMDALLLLKENQAENILVGGVDEMTDHNYLFYKKLGHWKSEITTADQLLKSGTPGTIGGEGAAFFILGNKKTPNTIAQLSAVEILFKPNENEIQNCLNRVLENQQHKKSDIDLVLYGRNGDTRTDKKYDTFQKTFFPDTTSASFKHLCGEYQTAGSFAMWLAASILKKQHLPSYLLSGNNSTERLYRILIYNIYEKNHSFLLVETAL